MALNRNTTLLILWALSLAGCGNDPARQSAGGSPMGLAGDVAPPVVTGTPECDALPVAPEADRVDLISPTFSTPFVTTNPLFPVGRLDRVVFLGESDGESFRSETTRFAGTKTIVLDGHPVRTIVSQYVAWVDRRIHEVALDWYGQDDAGNVWYFGEDVFNYEDGVVVNTDGTWLAGQSGPVAMIMPAAPEVGDVWRPENACPLVFEEVTALATNVTVDGPSGPVAGALQVKELHMDGTYEDKTFAPGYGEFSTGSGANAERIAVAVPPDFLGGREPEALEAISDVAEDLFRLGRRGTWNLIQRRFERLSNLWSRPTDPAPPPEVARAMDEAIDTLDEAIRVRDRGEVRQSAIDIALACTDLELRYDSRREIDLDLIDVWTMQLQLDTANGDRSGVTSDLETIRIIRQRLNSPSR